MDDRELLRAYVETDDEDAFARLVERYLGMVFAAALRRTGNRELAEEISQTVFTLLAKKATTLKPGTVIAGWLHRTAVLHSSHVLRAERTRIRKMNALSESLDENVSKDRHDWNEMLQLLDKSMSQLPTADRDVLFLRFFEDCTYRNIGERLGKSESATQRQANRALEKLSRLLRRRGVTISATALAAGLTTELAKSAPTGLASSITQSALSGTATVATSATLTNLLTLMTQTKISTLALAACGLIALCTGGGVLMGKLSNDGAAPASIPPLEKPSDLALGIRPSHAPESPGPQFSPEDKIAALLREAVLLLESSPPKSVESEVRSIIGNLAESDIEEAFAFAKNDASLDDEATSLLLDEIYRRWGEIAGEEALAVALALEDNEERKRIVSKVVNGWAEAEPEAAYAWYRENGAAAESAIGERTAQSLIGGIAKGWARKNLEGGFELLAGLDYDLQTVAVREVGDLGREPLMRGRLAPRIEALAPGTLRSELIKEFGSEWAKSEPREAAAWFDTFTFDSPTDRFTAANDIAEHFFEKHPREAVDWIYPKLPDDVKPQLLKQIVAGQWAERDRESAAKWLTDKGFDPNTLLP